MTSGRCARTAVLGSLLLAWFSFHPAPLLWWAVAALLGVAVAHRAGSEVFARTAAPAAGAATGPPSVTMDARR